MAQKKERMRESIILNTSDWSLDPINFSNHPEGTYTCWSQKGLFMTIQKKERKEWEEGLENWLEKKGVFRTVKRIRAIEIRVTKRWVAERHFSRFNRLLEENERREKAKKKNRMMKNKKRKKIVRVRVISSVPQVKNDLKLFQLEKSHSKHWEWKLFRVDVDWRDLVNSEFIDESWWQWKRKKRWKCTPKKSHTMTDGMIWENFAACSRRKLPQVHSTDAI